MLHGWDVCGVSSEKNECYYNLSKKINGTILDLQVSDGLIAREVLKDFVKGTYVKDPKDKYDTIGRVLKVTGVGWQVQWIYLPDTWCDHSLLEIVSGSVSLGVAGYTLDEPECLLPNGTEHHGWTIVSHGDENPVFKRYYSIEKQTKWVECSTRVHENRLEELQHLKQGNYVEHTNGDERYVGVVCIIEERGYGVSWLHHSYGWSDGPDTMSVYNRDELKNISPLEALQKLVVLNKKYGTYGKGSEVIVGIKPEFLMKSPKEQMENFVIGEIKAKRLDRTYCV